MDPVNGLGQIVQVLRKKLSDTSTTRTEKTSLPSKANAKPSSSTRKASSQEVQKKIGELIQAIPEADYTNDKATEIFVEVVIAWELGDEILQDPKFGELTKEVTKLISGNAELQEKMMQVIKGL